MVSIYQLKSAFQGLLRPFVCRLAPRITANQVTLSTMGASVLYGIALYGYPNCRLLWLGLPLFLFVRMALNAIDGMLAREFGQQSQLGGFLNEAGDVVSDSALILGLAAAAPEQAVSLAVVALLAVLTEFVGVCGWALCGVRRYDGPLGKSDRAFLLGVLGLLVGFGLPLNTALAYSLPFVAALLGWTSLNRVRQALVSHKESHR